MLDVVLPEAFEYYLALMRVLTVAVWAILPPLAIVLVAIDVPEGALAMSHVVLPKAFVFGAIGPRHSAPTVS